MNVLRNFTRLLLPTTRRRKARGGISLLEVLIAVFVLSFGLLGVAMIIPLGNWQLREALKADRGSACGRAALREMKIRGWLDPTQWVDFTNTPVPDPIPYADSYAVDPLLLSIAVPNGDTVAADFPYRNPNIAPPATSPQWAVMTRVSLPGGIMPQALADRIMIWRDDLLFPAEKEGRPRQMYLLPSGDSETSVDPATDNAVIAQNEGNFTWMATVTPLPGQSPANNSEITRYEVSIVVFYKRDFYVPDAANFGNAEFVPAERSVFAVLTGEGWGGGEVMLQSDNEAWLDVRESDWIMLKVLDGNTTRKVFKWYRVVGVDEEVLDLDTSDVPQPVAMPVPAGDTSGYGRYVTLAGPDWRIDRNNAGGIQLGFDSSVNPTLPFADWAEAAIVEDVAGVYTTVVEIGTGSAWSP